jgi:hypothetical protein
VFLSLVRESAPWLHDAGVEVYRAALSRQPHQLERAKREFRRLAEFADHPIFREYYQYDEDFYYLMRRLPEVIEPLLDGLRLKRSPNTSLPFSIEDQSRKPADGSES